MGHWTSTDAWRSNRDDGEEVHDEVASFSGGSAGGAPSRTATASRGLYDLMRRHFGAGRDPADTILTHVLSQAGDDILDSSVY